MLNKYDLDLQNDFHLSGTVWFMNVQLPNAKQRLYTMSSIMKPSLMILDYIK